MAAARSTLRCSTKRGSPSKGSSPGVMMSQNMRATALVRGRQGRRLKVLGSGRAYMSLSTERAYPSIVEPSKPMPRVRADSSSSTVMANPFRLPRMSVNQRRMNFTSFSRASRRMYSMASGFLSTIAGYSQVFAIGQGKSHLQHRIKWLVARVQGPVRRAEGQRKSSTKYSSL